MLACYVNNDSLTTVVPWQFCDHSRALSLPLAFCLTNAHTHTGDCYSVPSVSTLSASLMSDCVPQQEFYWHYCTYCGIIHWTKWIYELWNHSRGVMISYHGSVLAFVTIKHTDRVNTVNMLTLQGVKSWNSRVRMHCTSSFFPNSS